MEPDSPAGKAGLQSRDVLKSIGNESNGQQDVQNVEMVPELTKQYAGQTVTIQYQRDGVVKQTNVQLRSAAEVEASKNTDNPKGYIGIAPANFQVSRYTWSAPIVAGGLMTQFTELTFKGLGSAVAGLFSGDTAKATEQVTGPVGIFVVLQQGADLGFQFILMVIAIISLSLAIMNVLPIPALDGGRLFVTLLFRALKKPLTERREDAIHGTGFAALMVLFVLITIVDVKRFF